MTDSQKEEIIMLRSDGHTYSEISEKLGLSINTIKSFYRRCKNPKSETGTNLCKYCGKPVVQPKRIRQKKFCSDKCRMDWWNSHRDDINKKAVYSFKCQCCGREFKAYGNNNRKFCSRECYIKMRFGEDSNEQE